MSDLAGIVRRDDALLRQHGGVGLAGGDILPVEVPVEVDRGVDLLHDGGGAGREAPTPHLVALGLFLRHHSAPIMTEPSLEPREARLANAKKRLAIVLAGGFAGVVVGLAGIYGIGHLAGNVAVAPECRPAQETAKRIAPLIRGEVAALTLAKAPKRPPDLAFQRRKRSAQDAGRLARQDRAVQPVGHLVRALPQGNAGARRAAGQARRTGFRGGRGQHRHPRCCRNRRRG